MKFTFSWLKDHLDSQAPIDQIAATLSAIGLDVEGVDNPAEKLAAYLSDVAVSAPCIPVVNNVDVAVEREPQRIRQALARQASSPVRWVEIVRRFAADGISLVAECGPGKVLAGLTRRIEDGLQSHALTDPLSLQQALLALKS